MALRNLRYDGDSILRKKAKAVTEINNKIHALLDDMAETMYASNGVGLAAPQVGILKRMIVIDVGEGLVELINPEIIYTEGSQQCSEACLSVPGKSGTVERPLIAKARGLNRNGEEIVVEGEGFLAIALCHEIDHLDGILYTDKATEMKEYRDGEDEEEDEEDTEEEGEKGGMLS